MENTHNIWLLVAFCLALGAGLGFLLARFLPSKLKTPSGHELEQQQERFEQYQTNVISHLSLNTNLVGKVAQSLQEVQQHLANGVHQLALDEHARDRLLDALRMDSALTAYQKKERVMHSEPVKDYAPKVKNQLGTLDKSFGLHEK